MKKLPYNYYDLSPTIMPVKDVYRYLDELLTLIESDEYGEFEVLEALDELIVTRLSDNHASLQPEYSGRVFNWLVAHWPMTDLDHLDLYLTVIVNLQDNESIRKFLEAKLQQEELAVRKDLIRDALSEI